MIKKVKVLHRTYEVKAMPALEVAATGNHGVSKHREGIVEIDTSAKSDEVADTLLHEIMHCVVDTMGLQPVLEKGSEENIICCLSHGITTVFKDNPGLLSNLTKLLHE